MKFSCPNKNDIMYAKTEQVLGKELAHLVYNRNNGNPIDFAPNGEPSVLFQSLLEASGGNEEDAILAKAKYYSKDYLELNDWLEGEANSKLDKNGEPVLTEQEIEGFKFAPNAAVRKVDATALNSRMADLFTITAQERDNVNYKDKLLRLDKIREDTRLLRHVKDSIKDVITVGNTHLEYLKKLLKNKQVNTDEVFTASKMLDLWLDSKNLVSGKIAPAEKDELEALHGKFHTLSKSFNRLMEDTFIRETKNDSNINLKREDLKTNLEDRNFASAYTLASSRSKNLAVQAVNSFIDSARIETQDSQNKLMVELKEIEEYAKKNNIDLLDLTDKENRLSMLTRLNKDWFNILDDIRKTKSQAIKIKGKLAMTDWWKSMQEKIKDKAVVLDVNEFFDFDEDKGYTRKDNKDALDKLANQVDYPNKKMVKKLIEEKLAEQEKQLFNYYNMYLAKKQQLINNEITDNDFDLFIRNDSPDKFQEELKKKNGINPYCDGKYNVLIPISKELWNASFEKIDNNKELTHLYDRVSSVMNDLKNKLPFIMRNRLSPSFLPLVNKEIVKEGLSFFESLKQNIIPDFTFSDVIKDAKEIPIKYTGLTADEAKYIDKIETSRNLLAIISLFGESANHFYYFNQVKSSVLLGQEILKRSTPIKRDYMGKPIKNYGKEEYMAEGSGLENELNLLQETINYTMYQHKTKPEFALGSKFSAENLDDIVESIKEHLDLIANNKETPFTHSELLEESELVNKVQEYMKKSSKSKMGEQISNTRKGEDTTSLTNLYNFYLQKLEDYRKENKAGNLTEKEYKQLVKITGAKISSLQRKTVYGSRIIDNLIKKRRVLSLALNPITAFRNYVGGYLNALIFAGDGIDYEAKDLTRNLMSVSKLLLLKNDESYRLFKIAKNMMVLENTIDLQGMDEKSWFTKYGFKLMEKSEISVRMAIMMSVLKKDGMIDKFDNEGTLVDDTLSEEELKRLWRDTALKIERINTGVMGDTTNFKLINKNVLGRAIGQFKSSWMPEAFASRLEEESYDYKLGRNVKGRYLTYRDLGFVGSIIGTLQVYQSWLVGTKDFSNLKTRNGKTITQTDISNLYRNTIEVSFVMALATLGYVLKYLAEDEDEDKEIYMFFINQMLLIERDLTTVSPNTIQELIGGNLIPAWTVVRNLNNALASTFYLISDDEYEFEKWLYKVSKVVPLMNMFAQLQYQTQHSLEQLN